MDLSADAVSSAEISAKKSQYKVANAVKGFGNDVLRQLFGVKKGDVLPTEGEIKDLNKKDSKFSDQAYADTRAKVMKMYEDHRLKRIAQAESARVQQLQDKQKTDFDKLAAIRTGRQKRDNIAAAVSKSSAETGRSWGAE